MSVAHHTKNAYDYDAASTAIWPLSTTSPMTHSGCRICSARASSAVRFSPGTENRGRRWSADEEQHARGIIKLRGELHVRAEVAAVVRRAAGEEPLVGVARRPADEGNLIVEESQPDVRGGGHLPGVASRLKPVTSVAAWAPNSSARSAACLFSCFIHCTASATSSAVACSPLSAVVVTPKPSGLLSTNLSPTRAPRLSACAWARQIRRQSTRTWAHRL